MKRMIYLRRLGKLIKRYGAENVVYFDESGFKQHSHRPHGWTKRGQKLFGKVHGTNRKTVNLIMAQRQKEFLAPHFFSDTCTAETVINWLRDKLIPALTRPSVVVFDNAAFHKKKLIARLLKKHGHVALPLSPYSPDFNPIENSFGAIKKRRAFAPPDTPLLNLLAPLAKTSGS
jgi:putative transposase